MLIVFSSKHKNGHPLLVGNSHGSKHVHDDDSIVSASSMNDSLIYKECSDIVFSSELFANILARDADQEGPTLTLESAAVDYVSDLEG